MMTHDDIVKAWAKYKIVLNANGNVRTGPCRLSFPNLFEPQKLRNGKGDGKYGCALLFPIGVNYDLMKKVANEAATAKWGTKLPKIKSPFLDAHETQPETEGYEKGMLLIRANSTQKPGAVDRQMRDITDPSKLYAGCWVIATLRAFAYDVETEGGRSRGVSFGLQNVQFFADGEQFGGRSRANDDFETLEEADPFANADASEFDPSRGDAIDNAFA